MSKTWILVTSAHRARYFELDGDCGGLSELADFVYPTARATGQVAATDGAPKAHGRTAHAGTRFESHEDPEAIARHSFARQLADFLNRGVATHSCDRLEVIASSPMLGEIKPCLSTAASAALHHCIVSDLTRYQGADLKARINTALQLPA